MMFCRAVTLYWLNCIIDTNRATEGRLLAGSDLEVGSFVIICHSRQSPSLSRKNNSGMTVTEVY